MLFTPTIRTVILGNQVPGDTEINFPDLESDACLNGFLSRIQLVDLAGVLPPSNPIKGELWVDISGSEPLLKIWSGSEWILSTLSGSLFGFTNLNDTPTSYNPENANQFVRVNSTANGIRFSDINLLDLSDTPDSFADKGLRFLRVNATADGIEFADGTGLLVSWSNIIFDGSSLLDIADTPITYQNQSGRFLRVNSTEDGVEFADVNLLNDYDSFTSLEDTPNSFATQNGNYLRVNSTENQLEFVRPGQILAASTPIGRMDNFAINVSNTTKLYTDPRSGLTYYNPVGWSIGNSGAAADIARSDWLEFYTIMWQQPFSTVIGGKSNSATTDFSNNRVLLMPDLRGRGLIMHQTGNRPFGSLGGAATVTLGIEHMPSHTHGSQAVPHNHGISQKPHTHSFHQIDLNSDFGQPYPAQAHRNGPGNRITGGAYADISIQSATASVTIQNTGGGLAHENMPPYFAHTILIYTGLSA